MINTAQRNRFQSDGVASISQERLLLAVFDRLLLDLDRAITALSSRRPAEAHDQLVHAQKLLEELHLALDPGWEGTVNLAAVYLYAHELLVEANVRKDVQPVAEVKQLLAPLAATWREAYEQLTGAAAASAPAHPAGSFERGA